MFEVGDAVRINTLFDASNKPINGTIVSHHYDEGNVWVVRTSGGNLHDCCDSELSPAVDAYGHPWTRVQS